MGIHPLLSLPSSSFSSPISGPQQRHLCLLLRDTVPRPLPPICSDPRRFSSLTVTSPSPQQARHRIKTKTSWPESDLVAVPKTARSNPTSATLLSSSLSAPKSSAAYRRTHPRKLSRRRQRPLEYHESDHNTSIGSLRPHLVLA